jgi:hypothetical protein
MYTLILRNVDSARVAKRSRYIWFVLKRESATMRIVIIIDLLVTRSSSRRLTVTSLSLYVRVCVCIGVRERLSNKIFNFFRIFRRFIVLLRREVERCIMGLVVIVGY